MLEELPYQWLGNLQAMGSSFTLTRLQMQPASFIIELESGECAQMTIHNIVLSTDVQ